MAPMTPAGLALDSQSLEALRHQAKADPGKATRQAAQQFEAMFMNLLLKSMREAMPDYDPGSSNATKMYRGMLDTEMSQKLAGKGLGLADVMVRQLERAQSRGAVTHAAPAGVARPAIPAAAAAATPGTASVTGFSGASTGNVQRDFISRMKAPAEAASRASGIPTHFILGQAALESGWGKHEIRGNGGAPSHNLFGIKATGGWTGKTVDTLTTEYVNGQPRQQVEKFRAYDSYEAAFMDYAKLLGSNPRYAAAAKATQDANVFAARVQAAGYATDPRYASKLASVIHQARQIQVTV